MSMGNWKIKQVSKQTKASRTRSNRAKIYFAVPPADGWPTWSGSYSVFGVRNARK